MKIVHEPPALQELAEATTYYAERSAGLAHYFVDDFDTTVARIVEFPHAWPPVGRGVRRCLFAHFPYQLIYRVEGDEIRIYAVAHHKRKPRYWRKRLSK